MAWWWVIVSFLCGAVSGVVITAVIAADSARLKTEKKWDDE